jgi:serine/threonine protein kinase
MAAPVNWDQVQRIFLAAVDLSPEEQTRVLDEMCGANALLRAEVESLLGSDSSRTAGLAASVNTAINTEATSLFDQSRIAGSRVGAYRLIREIGRGGMGSVYLAERDDEQYESEVAIKLVRPGFDTDFILRRFKRERQILARLHHPNIARLFDGGTTDTGTPYLVMEYVPGSRITAYAEENHLSVEERLRLFLPVCAAVDYAHRAFVVHRDLKPGNILIDCHGTPKLLDFGISKLLHSEPRDPSDTQDITIATPDYASPEQIVGDPVTAASDIYSLGAVLYRLLTGAKPHRIESAGPLAIERAVCLEPTLPPSQAVRHNPALARRLAGDLDVIVLCAMHKQAERRYSSAEHLAADLRRHLEHLPVAARADSPAYRARKFIRRHRVSTAIAGAFAAAAATLAGFAAYEFDAGQNRVRRATDEEAALKRDLAVAYGRMGDLEANTAAGVREYSAMVAISRSLWEASPSDPRALSDYGAAQLGLGMVMPSDRAAEKRAALERAREWLQRQAEMNPAVPQLGEQLEKARTALDDLARRSVKR